MNEIRPRKVGAEALTRWLLEALELMKRKFWLWLVATILFSMLCTLAALFGFLYFSVFTITAASILGINYGVMIAAYTDRQLSGKELWRALRSPRPWLYTGRTILAFFRKNLVVLSVSVIGSFLASRTTDPSGQLLIPALLIGFLLGGLGLFVYLTLVVRDVETSSHRFLASVRLNLSWEASATLIFQGYKLNQAAIKQLYRRGATVSLVGLGMALFPLGQAAVVILAVILFPLASSVLYVSFRDIYLGVAKNSLARAEQRQTAPVPTST